MSTVATSSEVSNDCSPVDEDSYIEVVEVKGNYTCEIPNFMSYLSENENGQKISHEFTVGSYDEVKWGLIVCSNRGNGLNYKTFVSLFISPVFNSSVEILAMVKFSIIDVNNQKQIPKQTEFARRFQGQRFGIREFVENHCLSANGYLPLGKLVVFVEMQAVVYQSSFFKQSKCRLSHDISLLFADRKFSDAVLTAQGKDFFVHKAILAARSPVFAAMFQHDMVEKKENRVVITDIDCDVLEEMLRYIYTGTSQGIEGVAEGLLAAASKYDLGILKEKCGKIICSKLTVENVADNLMLADLHNVKYLRAQVIDFMITHATDVITTSAFKNMAPMWPNLLSEILLSAANRRLTAE